MYSPHTEFGKTKNVKVIVYLNNKIIESKEWDEVLWIERPEEMYGLMSDIYKDKRIRVIKREEWLRARKYV